MDDLATLTGAPRTVNIGGESFVIKPLTLADLGELQAWLEMQLPDPFAAVRKHLDLASVPMEVQKYLYSEALRTASTTRLHLSSPEALPYLNGPAGIIEILYLTIRKTKPAFTRDEAKATFSELTPQEILRIQGITEIGHVMAEPSDPKATPAG